MRHSFLIPTDPHSIVQRGKPGGLLLTIVLVTALTSCGKPDSPPPTQSAPTAANTPTVAEQPAATAEPEIAATPLDVTNTTWTPEGLENLLAPVALYPDAILAQVLMAATNPQEVLDAGNWLLQNESLQGKELNSAGEQMGFTPPVLALIQFPQVVDMMCQDLDWTTELGQAYVNDQAGVLDAAQRLRLQAQEVGNLQSSEEIKVETVTQGDQQVVTINPPNPQVVYVPQYDPVAVYAPAPAAPATTATSSTTVVETKTGYSTGALVTTGLLAFGGGILVSEIFDDDDDDYYGGGGYWGRPPPYYPPYPYRPPYGNGFYPSNNYNRPGGNFSNNNVIINQDNNYWNNRRTGNDRSPISEARPNRPELQGLNTQAAKGPKRPAPAKGEGYAAARKQDSGAARQQATARTGTANAQATRPKVQGSYAGAKPGGAQASREAASRNVAKTTGAYAGAKPDMQRPNTTAANRDRAKAGGSSGAGRPSGAANVDRGRAAPTAARPQAPARPAAKPASQSRPAAPQRQTGAANRGGSRSTAISGMNRGSNDRAASQRGRQSMSKGGASRSRQKSAGGGRRR
jgi:Protein of unknown function (DUF3300)